MKAANAANPTKAICPAAFEHEPIGRFLTLEITSAAVPHSASRIRKGTTNINESVNENRKGVAPKPGTTFGIRSKPK
jgi:hypothetical protein